MEAGRQCLGSRFGGEFGSAPVVGEAKVAKGCGRLHALVAQVVDGKDAARVLHITEPQKESLTVAAKVGWLAHAHHPDTNPWNCPPKCTALPELAA